MALSSAPGGTAESIFGRDSSAQHARDMDAINLIARGVPPLGSTAESNFFFRRDVSAQRANELDASGFSQQCTPGAPAAEKCCIDHSQHVAPDPKPIQ